MNERLDKLAQEIVDTYPYYEQFKKLNVCFHELPVIDKHIVNEHRELFQLPVPETAIESFTSGSTGIPFRCIKTQEEKMKLSMAIHRHRRRWGLPLRHRSIIIGNSLFAQPRMVANYANQIVKSSPHMIQGRCSGLCELANYVDTKNLAIPDDLLFVQNWGELVQPVQRKMIEDIFRVPLLDYYGMEEIWLIAFSNAEGLLEVDEQTVYIEILDPLTGMPVADGEPGDIAVTSYVMKSLPFVRYRSGDMGRVHRDRTSGKQIIELLPFRSAQIKFSNHTVDASIFRYLDQFYQWLSVEMGMKQFQMVQESYTSFHLFVVGVAADDTRLIEAARKLEVLLKQCLFVEHLDIAIDCVPSISPHPVSGKYQPFVSLVS